MPDGLSRIFLFLFQVNIYDYFNITFFTFTFDHLKNSRAAACAVICHISKIKNFYLKAKVFTGWVSKERPREEVTAEKSYKTFFPHTSNIGWKINRLRKKCRNSAKKRGKDALLHFKEDVYDY